MKLHALIVDDERNSRESLYHLIQQNCESVHVTGLMASVKEAKEFIKHTPVDVVFLDVAMPLESGFGLIPSLDTTKTSVVFTTAYEKYAIRAIRANAVDYLLKPIDILELKNTEQKILSIRSGRRVDAGVYQESLSNLERNYREKSIDKITLSFNHGIHIVNVDEIIHLEGENNYTTFHLKNDKPVVVCKTLKDYEDMLDANGFVRVHKSSIINLRYLKDLSRRDELVAELLDGTRIQVSRRRWPNLVQALEQFSVKK